MSQITTGIRSVLSHPFVYEIVQQIMGAHNVRVDIVRNHIRPFPGMRILDLGCGPADIVAHLPRDISYVGYDISESYIAQAKQKFPHQEFHARLLDESEAASLPPFDLVMAIGVLHHMDDSIAQQLMRIAKAALKPGGRLFTLDPCFADGQNPVARFLISKDRGQNVRTEPAYLALPQGIFPHIKGKLTHRAWIPYTHYSMECTA